jgi:hypothetical protein
MLAVCSVYDIEEVSRWHGRAEVSQNDLLLEVQST